MKSLFSTLFALLIVGSISAQNVGINTSTPEATLDVNGTAKVSSLASGATEMVVSDANGNLSTQPIPVAGVQSEISDADGDTKVEVEQSPDGQIEECAFWLNNRAASL
ncbi:MAG: hypothetical protein AAF399_26615 [Bacteroidota bacterium]